jgi:hypothetical protein
MKLGEPVLLLLTGVPVSLTMSTPGLTGTSKPCAALIAVGSARGRRCLVLTGLTRRKSLLVC